MFCVRISVVRTGKQITVPQLSSMCFTYSLGSFFTCHVFSAIWLQKLYYWIHLYVPQPSVSIRILFASSLDCNIMPTFTNVAVQSSVLYDGNICKEAIQLTFLRILDAVWKEDMLWLAYLGHAEVCGTNFCCQFSFHCFSS
jgi:hypothetical protein